MSNYEDFLINGFFLFIFIFNIRFYEENFPLINFYVYIFKDILVKKLPGILDHLNELGFVD